MSTRTLETILTARNQLSPELLKAARDVQQYKTTVEDANKSTASSAKAAAQEHTKAAKQIDDANKQVGMSSEEAARRVAGIRAELVQLGTKKVGVDIDTVEARIKLDEIRKQLTAVDGADPSARVDAETAAAEAQLRAVQGQLNRIDGQTVTATVDIDDRGSAARTSGGIGLVQGALLTIGPLLTPIGALGVAAFGALSGAAISAGAGVGVAAMAFSGVSDAVDLLDKRQTQLALDGAKAGATATASAAAQASAARQVESAEASLANTRENAADAAIRAAEQVTKARTTLARTEDQVARDIDRALDGQANAERDLTRAQRDQQQAQDDLTAARRTAQQQIEDLTGNVADNALSQRQAVLDVADAQDELTKAQSSGDKERIERADIAYRQQLRRQQDLTVQGQRLADQQAEATTRGVEGAAVVTAAQQRLNAANEKVGDSTKAIAAAAAATDQARVDGAARVAEAQQSVTDAVRDQASQTRQAAFSISQAQAGVTAAMAAVAAASQSAGGSGSEALSRINAELAGLNPATRSFAEYVQNRLKPAWKDLQATAADGLLPDVETGLERLMSLLPQADRIIGKTAHTLGGLALEASDALTGPEWGQFFDMIERDADPIIDNFGHTLLNMATGFTGVLTAFEPMALEVGDGIEGLSEDFRLWGLELGDSDGFHRFTDYVHDTWPEVKEIIGNVATIVGNLVEAGMPIGGAYLVGFKLLSDVLSGLPVPVVQALLVTLLAYKGLNAVTGILDRFGGSIGAVGKHAADAEVGAGRFSKAAGGVVGVMGGPWGIALTGAAIAVGQFASAIADASAQEDEWARDLVTGGTTAQKAMAGLAAERDKYGDNWIGDLSYSVDQFFGLASSMDDAKGKAHDLWAEMSPLQQATAKQAEWSETLNRRQNDQSTSAKDVAVAQDRLSYWSGEVARQQGQLDGVTQGTNLALAAQKRTLDDLTGAHVSASQAEADFYDATSRANGALENLTGNVLDNAGNLDVQSEAGRRAQDVLFGVRDAGNRLIDTMVNQGATTDQVNAKDAQLRDSFIRTAQQMGLSQDAAYRLADQIYGIPSERQTTINADVIAAKAAVAELQGQIDSVRGREVSITVSTKAPSAPSRATPTTGRVATRGTAPSTPRPGSSTRVRSCSLRRTWRLTAVRSRSSHSAGPGPCPATPVAASSVPSTCARTSMTRR
jgi:hypothetical protein